MDNTIQSPCVKILLMLKVVSNTTPILSLLKLNRLDILKNLYGHIYVPYAVYQEIEFGKNKSYYQDLFKIDWITILKISDVRKLKHVISLDAGEAEAIVLATEIDADLLIIDEKKGRFQATKFNLKITGTIGVLIKAKQKSVIGELKPLLFDLRSKGIWLDERFINQILKEVKE